MKVLSCTNLLDMESDGIPYLIETLVPQGTVVALIGNSDVAKSIFLRNMAYSYCSDAEQFLGYPILSSNRKCLYVSTEDAPLIVKDHLTKMGAVPCKNLLFGFDIENTNDNFFATLEEIQPSLIIIDAYGDVFEGDINNIIQTRHFFKKFKKYASTNNCSFVFLHHTTKAARNSSPSKHNANGSQGFEGACRLLMELRCENQKDRTLHIVKGNYLSNEVKSKEIILKLDGETLIFSKEGQRDNSNKRPKDYEKAKPIINDYVCSEERITKSQMVKMLKAQYGIGIGESTAAKYIKDAKEKIKSKVTEPKDSACFEVLE